MLFTLKTAIDRFLQTGLILSFVTLTVCVLWQVISRYLLNDPSVFTEEISRFSVIWLSLLGTAYACGRVEHMAYTMLEEKLSSPQALLMHTRIIAAIVLAFGVAVLLYGGGKLVLRAWQVEQLSATLEVPMAYVYACIPIAGITTVFYQVAILIAPGRFKAIKEEDAAIAHVEKELGS